MARVIREGFYSAADTILSASWSPHERAMFELGRPPSAGERRIAELRAADQTVARKSDLETEGR